MADETVTSSENPTIPDSVFEELEKVAEMEKSISFLQLRQGAVEKSMSEIRESIKTNQENVISDETKDEPKKENKDLVKEDKLNSQLTSIEKKRYENIGVEFGRGAEKVFRELKKAEELKKKMSTKNLEAANVKIDKKEGEKEKEKKKSGLGSLFLKLGIAIVAVVAVLGVFKEKIDEIIPGFSVNYDNFIQPIKNVGDKITNAIALFLENTIGEEIKNTFTEGDNSVKGLLIKFLTFHLPDVIFKSGLKLIEEFGGNVNTSMSYIDKQLQNSVEDSLRSGSKNEARIDAAEKRAKDNMGVLLDPLATEKALRHAKAEMGIDSITPLGSGFLEGFGKVLTDASVQNPSQFVSNSYASALMTALTETWQEGDEKKQINLEDGIGEDELKRIHQRLGISQKFEDWKSRSDVQQFFGLTQDVNANANAINNLKQGVANFNNRIIKFQNRAELQEINNQLKTSVRKDVIKNDGTKVVLDIKPEDLAQNAFVTEMNQVYEFFKAGIWGAEFGNVLLTSATEVTKNVYEQFLSPIFSIIKEAFPNLQTSSKIEQTNENVQGGEVSKGGTSSGGGASNQNSNNRASIDVKGNGNNPVVVIDFSLSPTIVQSAEKIAEGKTELLDQVKSTNEKLKSLSGIILKHRSFEDNEQKWLDAMNKKIGVQSDVLKNHETTLKYIVNYLEENDKDDTSNGQLPPFALQTQSS